MTFDFSKFAAPQSAPGTSAPAAVVAAPAIAPVPTAPPVAQVVNNPYTDIDKEEVNEHSRAPLCKHVQRDQNLPPERNMTAWQPATYFLGIREIEFKKVTTKKGGKTTLTEIKATVLAGDGDSPVGSDVSIAIFDSPFANKEIKKFCHAMENVHKSQPIGPAAAMMVHPSQPYAGRVVGVVVDNEKGKTGTPHAGKDFPRFRYFPAGVVGQSEDGKPVFGAIQNNTGL